MPNDWVFSLCAAFPDVFLPVCSIHPYRSDALAELCRAHSRGARMVKWLPNSMGIDPTHRLCRPFYALMRRLDMVLLTHTGKERTVDFAYHDDRLGNPILLRAPLDAGVKVIAAHCASEGEATLFGPELDQLDDDAQLDEDEDKNEEVGEEEQEEEEASSSHRVKRSKLVHEPSSAVSVSDSAPPPEPPSSWFSSLFGRQPDTVAAAAAARNAAASSSESSSRKRKVLAPRSRELPVKLDTFDIFLRMMDVKKYDGLLFGGETASEDKQECARSTPVKTVLTVCTSLPFARARAIPRHQLGHRIQARRCTRDFAQPTGSPPSPHQRIGLPVRK